MEKRLSGRVKVVFPLKVERVTSTYTVQDIFELDGEIINMSDTGACITSHKQLELNSGINFRIAIPKYSDASGIIEDLNIGADVVWVEKPLNETYRYRCGVKFLEPYSQGISMFKEMLYAEQERLSKGIWKASHPDFIFPTIPLSSKMLDNLAPTALSVDITNLCNLKCQHCFWHSYKDGLARRTNTNILDSVKEVLQKFPTITNITWYGGEPLINKETTALLEKGVTFKKNNLVITNGTFSIPDWHEDVIFGVSVDGTEDIHNRLRGVNVYKKIKSNICSAIAKGISVGILYCVNTINIDCIPDFIKEWSEAGLIEMVFTVYSPMKGKSSQLTLSDAHRDRVVSILLEMKRKYGKLISNTEAMIELIRVKYGDELAKRCPMNIFNKWTRIYSIHMCNDGSIRVPCALGRDVSHVHCRSVTKVALYAGKVLRDRESLLALFKMYHSKPHLKKTLMRSSEDLFREETP